MSRSRIKDWLCSEDTQILDSILFGQETVQVELNSNSNTSSILKNVINAASTKTKSNQFKLKNAEKITDTIDVSSDLKEIESYFEVQARPKFCQLCSQMPPASEVKSKPVPKEQTIGRSDTAMYEFSMNGGQNLLYEVTNPCNGLCDGDNYMNCFKNCTIDEIQKLRQNFWGYIAPTREERNKAMEKILHDFFIPGTKTFKFQVGSKKVCEQGFLRIIGLITTASTHKPEFWRNTKSKMINGKNEECDAEDAKIRQTRKVDHAMVFIRSLATMFGDFGYEDNNLSGKSDYLSRPSVMLDEETKKSILYLPYDSVKELYEEYLNYFNNEDANKTYDEKVTCGFTTFKLAFNNLKETIKLRTARGAFETCSVCNSLNDLLKNTKLKWSKEELQLVLKLKRLHLQQQAEERRNSEERKQLAAQSFSNDGQPEFAYFEADGYTEYKCLTPRIWQNRNSKGDTKRMGNRIIGINVVCGPIKTRFVYSLNDLVYGGANTMIEIMRQAIHDLGVLLAAIGLKIPRRLFCQFDNCGENKNKYMYGYFSLLNYLGHFDTIQINYLIVGHTHGPIDQYFSVISKKLWSTHFVGSPMALQCLINECQSPMINRQIYVHRDYKAWLDPILNKNIKYLQLPHVVLFSKELSLSILQHKAFSSRGDFLPLKPEGVSRIIDKSKLIEKFSTNDVSIEQLDQFGGVELLFKETYGATTTKQNLLFDKSCQDASRLVTNVINVLTDSHSASCIETLSTMQAEADSGYMSTMTDDDVNNNGELKDAHADKFMNFERSSPSIEDLKMLQDALKNSGTASRGFVLMLDYSQITPEWLNSSPHVFNYIEQEDVKEKLNIIDKEADNQVGINENPIIPKMQRKGKESIFSKISTIVQASKKILGEIENGVYPVASDLNEENNDPRDFFYKEKIFLEKEKRFFKQNSTSRGVLEALDHHVKEDRKLKFELFLMVHLSEEQIKDQAERKKKMEEQQVEAKKRIMYQLGNRYGNEYFHSESAGNVLPHAQPTGTSHASATLLGACEVVACNAPATKRCRAKKCNRSLCKDHFPAGGHTAHAGFEFKQAEQETTNEVIVASNEQPPNCEEEEEDDDDDNSSTTSKKVECSVQECLERAEHQCCKLGCRFTSICNFHYRNQHDSHANQMHVNDHAPPVNKKSRK